MPDADRRFISPSMLGPDLADSGQSSQEQVEVLREHLRAARKDTGPSVLMPPQRPSMSNRPYSQPNVQLGQQYLEKAAQHYCPPAPHESYSYSRRRSATYAGDPVTRPSEPVMQYRKPTATDASYDTPPLQYNYNQEQLHRPRSGSWFEQQQYPRYRRTSAAFQCRPQQHRQDYFSFAKPEPEPLPFPRTPSMTSQSDFSSDSSSDAEEPSRAHPNRNRHWRMF